MKQFWQSADTETTDKANSGQISHTTSSAKMNMNKDACNLCRRLKLNNYRKIRNQSVKMKSKLITKMVE